MEQNTIPATILAIDCGTQSLRAILFSQKGEMLARVQIEYEPYFCKQSGWAEQDPELYWNSLVNACQKLKESNPKLFESIAGVGVATQRASMVNVDEKGIPLRPAIIWLDQRRSKPVWGQKGLLNLGLKIAGLKKKLEDIQIQGKCNWIMQNQPEIWEKTHKYLQISGFLNHRLTGNFTDSVASQIGHIPFCYKTHAWAKDHQLAKKFFPIEKDKLPTLVPPGDLLGTISSQAERQIGIKKGTPVIACGSDKGCETLGAGVVNSKMASLSFGTTATVQTLSEKYIEPIKYLPAYPASVPGFYNPEIEIFRGFWMITWFKNEFAYKEVEQAKKMGIPAEEVLNQCLERTQPGAMGLIVQPYWGPGLDHPDAKGAMIGFGDVHTKDHIYRAVIEGLGFALWEGMEKIQDKTGIKIEKVAVSGGASQSDEICRITADIFNLPMVKGQTHETSGLGAAILVAKGLGWFSSLDETVENMVHAKKIFEPNQKHVQIYKALYSRVYAKMYSVLEPLYSQIREITGYPK
ncbi:FGGY-family carbohydrate kinase [Desulfobacula sp.]|uniref:FGGY-family carbohydrate kinase n=1 Tax=Desulfobacula sp. TaxID=2593537 RepID=UPI0025BABDDD|nr:FGGY-family carbohydrate kinase [Desulfobacula sp.]